MSDGNGPSCDNCGTAHGPDDIFCENCGYDFITGSLPGAGEGAGLAPATAPSPPGGQPTAPASGPGGDPASGATGPGSGPLAPQSGSFQPGSFGPPPGSGEAAASGGPGLFAGNGSGSGHAPVATRFAIAVDRAYFDAVVSEGELEFPDPVPPPHDLEVPGEEIHLGRTSESRAIHPDLDITVLTGDPAVSSRHAVIRRSPDGSLTVTDIGSTNGTFVGSVSSEPVTVGQPVPLQPGVPVYLGAWTRVVAVPDGAPAA